MSRSFGTTNAAPYANPPSVGAAGDTYFNTTNKTLYLSDGTQWIQVQGGGGAVTSLGPSAGQAILADRTTSTANTWLDWGSPITLPAASVPPGIGPITVLALVTGSANEFTQTQMLPQVRVAISMDNGATWSYGSVAQEAPVGMNSLFINRTPVTHSHVLTGTPTAAVLVKAQVQSDKTSSVFNAGQLSWWLGTGAVGPQGPQGPTGPPGTDPTSFLASYFTGNVNVTGSALPASTWTQLGYTLQGATGFTVTGSGGVNIVASQAGRYLVLINLGGYGSTVNVPRVDYRIDTKTAAGATKVSRQISGQSEQAGWNVSGFASAVVDLLAGEYVNIYIFPNAAGHVVDYGGAYSWVSVVPIGGPQGPVGPTGPDIAAAQSSYFYATAVGPLSVQTLTPVTWGTTIIANGFSGTAAIVAANTGRYRVAAQISGSNGAAVSAYRICHIKQYSSGAVLKVDRAVVNPATAANVWGTWFAEAILDMVAGDYVRIEIESDVTIALDQSGRNWLEITPVGGVKGDKGDPGALGTLAAASWLWASFSAPVPQIGAGVVQPITFGNVAQISGFHQSGASIICDVAGKYRVTTLISQLTGGTASNYTIVTIVVYTAGGAQRTSSQFVGGYIPANAYHGPIVADGEWDLAVGEYVQVTFQPYSASTLESRSYIHITPVGGAKGDKGDPGNAITVGGKPWQVLTKRSTIDGDAIWRTPPVGPQSSICWRYPALLNSWTNYGNPFTGARYGRRNSVIYLQGLVSRAANLSSPNANLFGIDKGYTPGAPGTTGQNVLQWVPAQSGAQLARLDFLSYSPGPPNGQGMVVTSDQTGGTGTNAGWMSISNVSAPLDGMNGIEQGFEITVNADSSVYIAGGAMWIAGVRYEVPPGVVGTVLNPGGPIRLVAVFPYMGSLNDIRYGMIDGTNEESARSMGFSSYYWGYDGIGTSYPWPSIATRTNGVWADRREWV
jgi:hypothetical protein